MSRKSELAEARAAGDADAMRTAIAVMLAPTELRTELRAARQAAAAELLDSIGLSAALRAACARAGSQAAFARQAGVSAQLISDVLGAKREANDRILSQLGLRRVVRFERTRRPA